MENKGRIHTFYIWKLIDIFYEQLRTDFHFGYIKEKKSLLYAEKTCSLVIKIYTKICWTNCV